MVLRQRKSYQAAPTFDAQEGTDYAASFWQSQTYFSLRNWTVFFLLSIGLFLFIGPSATMFSLTMKRIATMGFVWSVGDIIRGQKVALYGLLLSICLYSVPWHAPVYNSLWPCHEFKQMIYELQHESHTFDAQGHPFGPRRFQALGLGNGYMEELGRALEVHFDRFGRNETGRFYYVSELNLISNLFDERGLDHVLKALDHPHAYTNMLLMGRNKHLGDQAAERLADFGQKPSSVTWIEFGGTSVSSLGLKRLYEMAGVRSIEYLGLEYTDGYLWPKAVRNSLHHLNQATQLQELGLTGNKLSDADMITLTDTALKTSITKLGLTNNRISSSGVTALLPLLTQLKELQLGINGRIGDQGAIQLAKAMNDTGSSSSSSSTVESLSMFDCGVGQPGAEAFLGIFPNNRKLTYLSLTLSNQQSTLIQRQTLVALGAALISNDNGE